MARPLSLPELRRQGFPLGLLGATISRHVAMLKTLCFDDNERGALADVDQVLARRVVTAVNIALSRSGKPLRLRYLKVNPTRHHHLEMQYEFVPLPELTDPPGAPRPTARVVAEPLSFALFEPSKKAQAMERKALEDGEEREYAAPRRGVGLNPHKAKAKMKGAEAAQARRRARQADA